MIRPAPLLAALLLVGCPDRVEPPPIDSGPIVLDDGAVVMRLDSDRDGLCDTTEIDWGTDPNSVDTDLDGISDRAERDFGYQPLTPSSPEREILIFLTETETASVQFPVTRVVTGDGESYAGGFESFPVLDRLDLTAASYLERATAVGAIPPENVFEVLEDEQRFVGVFGRTQMVFELRFSFAGQIPRSCIRGYPFRYLIKRSDGRIVFQDRYLLLILPPGQRLDTADWCLEGDCI